MSLLQKLYECQNAGELLFDGTKGIDEVESEFYFDKLYEYVCSLLPEGDTAAQNRVHLLINGAIQTKAEQEYKRGIRLAVRFMTEAMQPIPKTIGEIHRDFDRIAQ